MKEVPFCVNCVHADTFMTVVCQARAKKTRNPVTGSWRWVGEAWADAARKKGGFCGPRGRLFEAKPVPVPEPTFLGRVVGRIFGTWPALIELLGVK